MRFILGLRRTILILFWLSLTSCDSADHSVFRIGANNWPGYAPLYLAQERGLLAPQNIKVVQLPSSSEVIHALRHGNLEAAALTLDETLTLIQDEIGLTVVLIFDFSDGADALMVKPGVNNLKQLKGKTIAVESTAVGAVMLDSALESAGLTSADIRVVNCEFNHHLACFKKYDAVVTFEPNKSKIVEMGGTQLFDSSSIPGKIVDLLVVRTSLVKANKSRLDALKMAYYQARDSMLTNTKASNIVLQPVVGLSTSQLQAALKGMYLPDRAECKQWFGDKRSPLRINAEKLGQIMLRSKLLARPPELSYLSLYKDE